MVDQKLPALSMTFAGVGGGSITIRAAPLGSYFYDAGGGQFCLGVYGGGDQGEATMGDAFMRGFVTVIDVANKKIGVRTDSYTARRPRRSARGRD